MFTGIVTDVGEIVSAEGTQGTLMRLRIHLVLRSGDDHARRLHRLRGAMPDGGRVRPARQRVLVRGRCSRKKRSPAPLSANGGRARVNLERSLKIGDELGGHIVTGHVDGVATIVLRTRITAWDEPWGRRPGSTSAPHDRCPASSPRRAASASTARRSPSTRSRTTSSRCSSSRTPLPSPPGASATRATASISKSISWPATPPAWRRGRQGRGADRLFRKGEAGRDGCAALPDKSRYSPHPMRVAHPPLSRARRSIGSPMVSPTSASAPSARRFPVPGS